MKNFLIPLAIGTALAGTLVFARPVFGAVRCETQYGGGEVCVRTGNLQIIKQVFNPDNNEFVDNLGLTSHRFLNGDEVTFDLTIKNIGDETFNKVTVTDTLPSHMDLVSGDLNFEIDNLDPGESVDRKIVARVKDVGDNEVICEVNTAEANAEDGDDNHDKDTSQVCMGKKVLGVTTLPSTGPSGVILALAASVVAATSGIFLVRLSR